MRFLILHIRKIVWTFSLIFAAAVFVYIRLTIRSADLQNIRLAEVYALTAISYLYLSLLASPLYSVFSKFPFRPIYIKARRALGTSAFFFGSLHAFIAFNFLLGGFGGLKFLSSLYITAIIYSGSALLILSVMAATSFDFMVKKLGSKWKRLHRLIYLVAVLITIHAFLLGTHFADIYTIVPQIFFVAVALLLLLESTRLAKYLIAKMPRYSLFIMNILVFASFMVILFGIYKIALPGGFGVHHH